MIEQGPTEKAIFERSVRYKMPLPDSLKNAPTLNIGLGFYYNAFKELSTCRVNGMGIGNITYFDCLKYCVENDIVDEQREDFIVVITAMDSAYLEHMLEKQKTKTAKVPDGKPT